LEKKDRFEREKGEEREKIKKNEVNLTGWEFVTF
jgi:hypothetical protein